MLSLGNTYDITEVEAFADRAAKSIGNAFTYSCELKFDMPYIPQRQIVQGTYPWRRNGR